MKKLDEEIINQHSLNGLNLNESSNTIIKTKRSNYSESLDKLNKSVNDTLLSYSPKLQAELAKSRVRLKINIKPEDIKTRLELKEENKLMPSLLELKHSMTNRNRILKKVERLCNSDDENEHSDEEYKDTKGIISNSNIYLKIWCYIISVNTLFICFITPYEVAFLNETSFDVFEILSLFLLCGDIIMNFFSTTADNNKIFLKQNIKDYFKSWFIIDCLGVFPFFVMIFDNDNNKIRILSNLPKLFRIFKLIQNRNIQRCLNSIVEKLKLEINYQRCFILLFVFAFLNHLCACLFYAIAKYENFNPSTWVYVKGYLDKNEIQLYFLSLYWTLTTVTTVGYGDISAVCSLEKIYTIFIISIGVVMYSFFIGTLSVIIAAINEEQNELNEKLGYVNQIQRVFDISDDLYEKVKRAVKFGTNKAQIDNKILLQNLPIKLRLELSRILNDKMIQNFIFFRNKSEEFYVHASPLLKSYMYYQNDYLFEPKAQIEDRKGTVVYCLPKKYDEREVRTLKKNWNFGEIEMCTGQSINYSIKIKSRMAELYMLKKTDFISLSVNFQNYIEEFLEHSLIIYKEFKERYYRLIHECNDLEMKVTDYQIKIAKEILDQSKSSSGSSEINDQLSNGDDDNKNSINKKRLSRNTIKMISYIKLEDQRINNLIDSLSKKMKEKNIVFSSNKTFDPYKMLQAVKFETNIETKLNTLNQIEEIVKSID